MASAWGSLDFCAPSGHVTAMAAYRHPIAVAPMMDWTDRHCRVFHRQLTRRALLYTEMIVADAVINGDRARLLGFSPEEHPVAIQLGGAEPSKLAQAAAIAADHGYDEINLNVGCPSDRVRSGTFGACLMRQPALVGDIVAAIKAAVALPVTVKCRLGVDEQDVGEALDALAGAVIAAGSDAIWVHARKAWLKGLSPKENREAPTIDYAAAGALKAKHPDVFVGVNGGIGSLDHAVDLLAAFGFDGAMLGRAAYHTPAILADVDRRFYDEAATSRDLGEVVEAMVAYIDAERARGTRLSSITRHMLGLFHGRAGARRWRQILSTRANHPAAGVETVREALAAVAGPGRSLDFALQTSQTGAPTHALA